MDSKAWQIVQDYHIKAVQDKFKCIKCHNLLTQAMQTPCGCFICEECANQHFNVTVGRPCPGATLDCDSNIIFEQNRPDNAKRREIAQLQIDCPIGKEVCGKLQMTGMVDHVANCPCRIIPCAASCGAELQHRHYEKHKEACPKRMMVCENCFEAMPKSQYELQHLSRRAPKCRKYEFACPFCDLRGPFTSATLPQHSGVCPNWEMQRALDECPKPFHTSGRALALVDQYRVAHLNQLAARAQSVYKEAAKMHSLTQKLEVDYINGDNHLSEYVNVQEALLTSIQQLYCHNASGTMSQRRSAIQLVEDNNHTKYRSAFDAVEQLRPAVAESEEWWEILTENVNACPGYVWKLGRMNELKQRGEKFVESDTFYVGQPPSYRLGLRVCWNPPEFNHIVVALRILGGRYDTLLEWPPIRQRIKLTLHSAIALKREVFFSIPLTAPPVQDLAYNIIDLEFIDWESLKRNYIFENSFFLSCGIE